MPVAGKLFDGSISEDVVLIPTKPGTYTLDPVSYTYFDPKAGAYRTVTTEGAAVTINPVTPSELASQPLLAPPTPGGIGKPSAATPAVSLPAPPAAPAGIPLDPLAGASFGLVPLSRPALSLWVALSFLWLVPAWLVLAALRSRQTDPFRARREARLRLGQTIAYLRGTADSDARRQALHAWQRDAAILLGIAHAAPSSGVIARAGPAAGPTEPETRLPSPNTHAWVVLWAEADRTLYGEDGRLPETWLVRAEAAVEATAVPAWRVLSLFRRANLLPWVTPGARHRAPGRTAARSLGSTTALLLLLALAMHPRPALAAGGAATASGSSAAPATRAPTYYPSPLAAYNAGDFDAAERAWRAAVGRQPTNWIARHNLALALAQQGRWPEAAAHWTSAFLLDPRNTSVRWHLALGYERAGYAPPYLGEFAAASGPHLVARLASPAEWQWLLVLGGVILTAGVLWLLLRAYRPTPKWSRPAAPVAMGAGLLLVLVAATSLHLYGDTVNPRAVLVWHQVLLRSIPTEADTQQQTSSLPAGTLAVADKPFLDWIRLDFPNGQTGWVRQDDVVWLYR